MKYEILIETAQSQHLKAADEQMRRKVQTADAKFTSDAPCRHSSPIIFPTQAMDIREIKQRKPSGASVICLRLSENLHLR